MPDRLTGLSGLEELKKLNCARKWNFIQVQHNSWFAPQDACTIWSKMHVHDFKLKRFPNGEVKDECMTCKIARYVFDCLVGPDQNILLCLVYI